MYKLISFYSEPQAGTYYTDASVRMKKSCDRLDIPCNIEERENRGDWMANTKMKPHYILEQWELSDVPVLWVDVDCKIHQKPDLSEYLDVDFAAAEFQGVSRLDPPLKIMGITLFFNKTAGAKLLLERWCDVCDAPNELHGDHRLLSDLLYDPTGFSYEILPIRFGAITTKADSTVISLGLARNIKSKNDLMIWLEQNREHFNGQ